MYGFIYILSSASYHFSNLADIPLNYIKNCLNKYNLKINVNKCSYTMIKYGKNITHIPRIKIGGEIIKYSNGIKYLGIIIDKNFSFYTSFKYLKI